MNPHHTVDAVAAGAITVAWLGVLQPILAAIVTLLSGVWFACQITRFIIEGRRARKQRRRKSDVADA